MFGSARIQQSFVILVLVIHGIWIGNHLLWVADDQIDPWKLGGYGMYTVPSPDVQLAISWISSSGSTRVLDPSRYSLGAFERSVAHTNPKRTFRCAPIESEDLRAFFDENPLLRSLNLIFIFTERRFLRDPVKLERQEQGRVQIQWIDDHNLVYANQFCGTVETGEVSEI